MQIRIIIHNTS